MSPNPDQIAITGVSGRYPNSSNIEELRQSLLAGTDLVSNHSRWAYESQGTSPRMGYLKDLEYFDHSFFGMDQSEADLNDPKLRTVLEVTFEAIVDAGLNPTELRGSRTGVFFGVSNNSFIESRSKNQILGRSAAMIANTISYSFDFKGPSYALDTACSTGLYAFTQGADAIINDRCDIAVVCAAQTQFNPWESAQFTKLGVLPLEGRCRTFDLNRLGYVKAEAIVTVILQRVHESKRIYATVAGCGSNVDGYKQEGFVFPSYIMQRAMLETVFKRFNLDPLDVNYMEAHGTATKVGDVQETQAIDEFFCKDKERKKPLLLGSVKSNLGHSEAASGLVSLTKILLCCHGGVIPGNLHYKIPDPEIKGIWEGRLQVMDKNTPLPDGLICVNSFGMGGANATAVLRPFTEKRKVVNDLEYRLVQVSGRTEEGLQLMLTRIIENRANHEFLSLIDSVFSKRIVGHNYRGYAILSKDSRYEISRCPTKPRPIWYAYSGMGTEWPGMGRDLMKFEVFQNTIQKCAQALKPYGIDLEDVVVNGTDKTFTDVVNTFTAITAVSVALTDVLSSLGIQPDGIIGHTFGEIGCAYADGLITAEQATLIAYARGSATYTSDLIKGLMASVGTSVKECEKILPEGVFVACDNSEDNVTIAGPEEIVKSFCKTLTARGIYNRIIDTSNYAFHCPYLKPAGPKMLEFVKKVLPETKLRSRWLPSAVDESEWNSELGRYNSAEYHYHNFMNRVHFRQLLKHVPEDAILIEVAPANILRTIFKRALDQNVTVLPLASKGVDNWEFFLSCIGKFYNSGGETDLTKFYKPPTFPVSITTPTISNLINWDHTVKFHVPKYNPEAIFGKRIEIDLNEQENKYLEGHEIDGKILFPATGHLFMVWKTYAKLLGQAYLQMPVVFEEVKTLRPVFLPKNETTVLVINLMKSTGYFEICLDGEAAAVLTGTVSVPEHTDEEFLNYSELPEPETNKLMNSDDFYKFLNLKGYDYSGVFLGIQQCDIDGRSASLKWFNNWVAFMEAMVQHLIGLDQTQGICLPSKFDKIVIDPQRHLDAIGPNDLLRLDYNKYVGAAKCGGIEIRKGRGVNVKRGHADSEPILEKLVFVPSTTTDDQSNLDALTYSLTVASQILVENAVDHLSLKIADVASTNAIPILKSVLHKANLKKISFYQIASLTLDNFDLVITKDITRESNETISNMTRRAKFIFAEIQHYDDGFAKSHALETIHKHVTNSGTFVLFKASRNLPEEFSVVRTNNSDFNWLEELKAAIRDRKSLNSRIYLVNEDYNSGVVGLFTSIRQEQIASNLRIFLMRNGEGMEKFSLQSEFYLAQLRKDLAVNVYHQNSWGGYRLMPLEPIQKRLFSDAACLKTTGLKWVQQSPYCSPVGRKVSVHYAALNQSDVAIANGKAGDGESLGLEYSGVDDKGNKVMGLVPRGALATSVQAHPKLIWTMPPKWSMEEAATVPLIYTLSHYGLVVRGRLSPSDTVLIHNGTSDVSLAAIALAVNKNCTVFAIVNFSAEKELLKRLFPKVPESNIIVDSKVLPFHEAILRTGNRNVNVVFNCKSLQIVKLSMKCSSKNARFVEINNKITDNVVADHLLDKGCNYYNITIADIFEASNRILDDISTDLENYLKSGVVTPFKFTIFANNDIEEAIQQLEANQVVGKCLIKVKDHVGLLARSDNRILAFPRTYMDPQKSYVIIGGLDGLGLELAQWLISRGATKIILNSFSHMSSGYQVLLLEKWRKQGIAVFTEASDSTGLDGAESLLNFAIGLGPVGGIFNAALSLRDEVLINQSVSSFAAAVAPKLFTTQNMDFLTRKLCKELDYFVVFSSIVASFGNKSQSNYGFANSAVERVCESRKAEGLPALSVEWGAMGEVGFMVKLESSGGVLEDLGRQKVQSCWDVLDQFLQQPEPVVLSYVYGDESATLGKGSLAESVVTIFEASAA